MNKTFYYSKIVAIHFLMASSIQSCVSKPVPDEKLAIGKEYLEIFCSFMKRDTIHFENLKGNKKSFLIMQLDSVIRNKKGWFINEEPYKLLQIKYKQIGNDTIALIRENEVFVNKYPEQHRSSLVIRFNNLFFNDTILPVLHSDTLHINNKKIVDYYVFKSSLNSKNPEDVEELIISPAKGLLAFKTVSGETWTNIYSN